MWVLAGSARIRRLSRCHYRPSAATASSWSDRRALQTQRPALGPAVPYIRLGRPITVVT
ncbi:hypothetical protein Pd630_LPD10095 (plasmid) [Rhodococcus opacus PD630]|nr:hypothetical protein Pd630_LPD10095 [Rhodococcus opacus PD630]